MIVVSMSETRLVLDLLERVEQASRAELEGMADGVNPAISKLASRELAMRDVRAMRQG